MATRTGGGERGVTITPQARTIAGWLVAIILIVAAAFFVGRVGSPDAPSAAGSGSPSATESLLPIAFGTGLDETTGEVAVDLRTGRFAAGDLFAYSVRPSEPPGTPELYVEVIRIDPDQSVTPVQTPTPQEIIPSADVIAFDVPADDLIDAFGPGSFLMRIYLERDGSPIAEGRFELVAPVAS